MRLILHTPESEGELRNVYREAFENAVELFIVTAFLTAWDSDLELNPRCRRFRVIVGKDFGITKKDACVTLMRWLPKNRRHEFMVADRITGFHPKAMFWKDSKNATYAIIGSSNLTPAAFETNYESNMYCVISKEEYTHAKEWINGIERQSLVVSEDWLAKYKEMPSSSGGGSQRRAKAEPDMHPLVAFDLPRPHGMNKLIRDRRQHLASFEENREFLIDLFRRCDNAEIDSEEFYDELPDYWSFQVGDRLQGSGWE
jgi:HKD family nuclease